VFPDPTGAARNRVAIGKIAFSCNNCYFSPCNNLNRVEIDAAGLIGAAAKNIYAFNFY
jgi:hypothetical protein